jgi:probable blue pigment (indigoidine) exporter
VRTPTGRASPSQLAYTVSGAFAPIVWGTTYYVTSQLLPPGHPMTSSVLRALPAGLLLLALAPGLPPRGWRVRIIVLGLLNIGFFFPLLFIAAYRLPGGIASVVGALQPLVIIGICTAARWQRANARQLGWCLLSVVGVAMTTLSASGHLDPLGLVAAVLGTVSMATGILLTRRWGVAPGMHPLTATGWQLVVGAIVISPLIPVVDTGPWHLTTGGVAGYLWLTLIGGALAYALWFRSARVLPPANVSLLGVLSPLTAVIVGWIALRQSLSLVQVGGFALALTGSFAGQVVGQRRSQIPHPCPSPPATTDQGELL